MDRSETLILIRQLLEELEIKGEVDRRGFQIAVLNALKALLEKEERS